ncbi:PAS domain-containing protein [Parvularcula sp. ZS-1/3]|uniref:histidine kinase n=1 Tax=Parvularcula mediterranea TaxID=2732508 RepID=A0A7Y3RL12_9PROT|nr:PAS-domain containing protein [Parvularcula mediterranea]NNU15555.1 PAS domain-containing protein [Parvularcula mediterranea]
MSTVTVGAALAIYAAVLFAVGFMAQKRGSFPPRTLPLVTALSIGVYCTSWTFYGAVGTAARSGWDYLPIYLGPVLAFTLGLPLIERTISLGKAHGATSLPDLISRRFGRSRSLAALLSGTLVLVSIPYITLQLIAVASTFSVVTGGEETRSQALILSVGAVLAAFGLVFGTRSRDATERSPGLVAAMAFDSVFKLLAFFVVALVALAILSGGEITAPPLPSAEGFTAPRFLLLTALSAFMVLCLPRQFHMTVVEPDGPRTVRRAAPILILYLGLFALLVLPIAGAGAGLGLGASPDIFVLTVPRASGAEALTLLAFVGGFAAAAGMIVVTGIAVGNMISNDLVLPLLSNAGEARAFKHALTIRRLSLCALIVIASLFALTVPEGAMLAELGVVSFAGAAQLAPLLIAAIFAPRVTSPAAVAAIVTGVSLWLILVLGPVVAGGTAFDASPLLKMLLPFIDDQFTAGTLIAGLANVSVLVALTLLAPADLKAREDAARFNSQRAQGALSGTVRVGDLRALLEQIVGKDVAASTARPYANLRDSDLAPAAFVEESERRLSGVLGNASANILLTRLLTSSRVAVGDVMVLMGDASRELRFGQDLLLATLDSLAEGVSVIDAEGKLVAWNKAYEELFDYPSGLLAVGTPVETLLRHNLPRAPEAKLQKRIALLKDGIPHTSETTLRDGRILRLQGRPVPGGGYVTSFSDVTEYRVAQTALAESERTLRFYTDNIPFPIAFADPGQTIRFHNRAYAEMTGMLDQSLVGLPLATVLGEHYAKRSIAIDAVLEGSGRRFVLSPDDIGGDVTWQVTYVPQVSQSGTVLGFFGFYQDISKRRAAQSALEEANRTLEARVEQRTAELSLANTAADSARQEAEAANQSKTRFLAAASHDVLQPLNAARLFASSLEDTLPEGSDEAGTATRIGAAIGSADTLLRSLLNLSKLEAGGVDPKKSAFALGPYLEGIAEEFRPLAEEQGLTLRVVSTGLWTDTDPGLLRSAIQNLLANAVRYTDEGGVLIGVRRVWGRLALDIIDSGRGIAAEDQATIFKEFTRLPRDRDVEGAGLGLATVSRVAGLLGHDIILSSDPGKGTRFRLLIPRAEPRSAVASPRRRSAPGFGGARVLCVDNDRSVLEALEARFTKWGAETSALGSVDAVRAAYANGAAMPDLLILDYQLDGDETGLDVFDFFAEEKECRLPAIVVTASRSEATDEAVRSRGLDILSKPVEPAALRSLSVSLLNAPKV